MVEQIENFISDDVCDSLIEEGLKCFNASTVLGEAVEGYRSAVDCFLSNNNSYANEIKKNLSTYFSIPFENMEDIDIIKYEKGGEYKLHHDFFHSSETYYSGEIERGGQRILTFLIYLNDNFEGGETEFPKHDLKITPKKGKLVVWTNTTEDGSVDYDSLHAGLPVINGVKYIGVIWVRESKFY
jgi:prolyl 4-hydroxylase